MTERETIDTDVVIVGAGPAGLAAAIRLKQKAPELSVTVVEKAAEIGGHILSGAVMDPRGLDALIPDWRERGAPVGPKVTRDTYHYLTPRRDFAFPHVLLPPQMKTPDGVIVSLGDLVRWLGAQAQALGVDVFPMTAAVDVLGPPGGPVRGIVTGDLGVDRDGKPKPGFAAGIGINAKYTLVAEGARGSLARRLSAAHRLERQPQKYGLGIKEVWEIAADRHEPGRADHYLGFPLDNRTSGGGFAYHAENRKLYLGLVVHLDYADPSLSPFGEFQRFKAHPSIAPLLAGATRLSYGARALAAGGWQSLPTLAFPGGALIGCAAGFMNAARLKAIHNAILSGIGAADAVAEAIGKGRSHDVIKGLARYVFAHGVMDELRAVQNVKPLWSRLGTIAGAAAAGADMWATALLGHSPLGALAHRGSDAAALRPLGSRPARAYLPPDGAASFDRASSVFLANIAHDEDQPVHLRLANPGVPLHDTLPVFGVEPAPLYCPAGVYEIAETGEGPVFRINAANCVHCKTCDIKDPARNITWVLPRVGPGRTMWGCEPMTPQEFVNKWKDNALSERSAAQQHFLHLCALFNHPTPAAVDKLGEEFTFERGLTKTGGGQGFADVWKKGFFAWEYKKRRRNLDDALEQLTRYASALENPPLHVACDTQKFKIVTAWTNLVPTTYELALEDLLDPAKRKILENVFLKPDALRPGVTREKLTREAADKFTTIADRLNHRHPNREAVAHFVNQLAFCFFAEDVGLLPIDPVTERDGYFTKLLKNALKNPSRSKDLLDGLFEAMQHGGPQGIEQINHFNGGLFDDRRAFPLQADELRILSDLGRLEWDQIDPTIFGTLFERFLDPDKRKQIGAHYTDPEKIMMIVNPVIVRPLAREWEEARTRIAGLMDGSIKPPRRESGSGSFRPLDAAIGEREKFLKRLRGTSVLDPACGSGNFLYLALHAIKDIENRALLECESLGLPPEVPIIGPEILHGIELSPLAAELARTTIWIGFIQWEIKNMVGVGQRPILRKLDSIECRDALVTLVPPTSTPLPVGEGLPPGADPGVVAPAPGEVTVPNTYVEAEWPEAEFIIGNPPFLGGKRLRTELGDATVETLFQIFDGRVPREADLVTYWFEKARERIAAGAASAAGLVTTNSIRGGANRKLLQRVIADAPIFEAWSDEPWVVEGAAVRVSVVCFGRNFGQTSLALDGAPVAAIRSDLSSAESDLTTAERLNSNVGVAFMGDTKGGAFDIPGELARQFLTEPLNPNGRPNSDVVRPWLNGLDVTRRPRDVWILDFGWTISEPQSALYEAPFAYALREIAPARRAI